MNKPPGAGSPTPASRTCLVAIVTSQQVHALAGQADQQDGGTCHPDDLPEGYHTAARGQSIARPAAVGVEGCPRTSARSDWRQVDGMALGRRVGGAAAGPGCDQMC